MRASTKLGSAIKRFWFEQTVLDPAARFLTSVSKFKKWHRAEMLSFPYPGDSFCCCGILINYFCFDALERLETALGSLTHLRRRENTINKGCCGAKYDFYRAHERRCRYPRRNCRAPEMILFIAQ